MTRSYSAIAEILHRALSLTRPPIAVSFVDTPPPDVERFQGRVPAGCSFWAEAATRTFVTSAEDHDLCAIGTYTHNLKVSPAHEAERGEVLAVFANLGYVRPEDIPLIPVLAKSPQHVVYGPLAATPFPPDVALLFVRAEQSLILSEASQAVDQGLPPAMGRPACAIIPQSVNSGRAALSLGCCGARAYVDGLGADVALYALPGARLDEYAERVEDFARANRVLATFHRVRRRDVERGRAPSVRESIAALAGGERL